MAYTKNTWNVSDPITKEKMDIIETGIYNAHQTADSNSGIISGTNTALSNLQITVGGVSTTANNALLTANTALEETQQGKDAWTQVASVITIDQQTGEITKNLATRVSEIDDRAGTASLNASQALTAINNAKGQKNFYGNGATSENLRAKLDDMEAKIRNDYDEFTTIRDYYVDAKGAYYATLQDRLNSIDGATNTYHSKSLSQHVVDLENEVNGTHTNSAASLTARFEANEEAIGNLNTNKIPYSAIVTNLETNNDNKPLAASQGRKLAQIIGGEYSTTNTVAEGITLAETNAKEYAKNYADDRFGTGVGTNNTGTGATATAGKQLADIRTAIGTDTTANTIKGRIASLETKNANLEEAIGTNTTADTVKYRIKQLEDEVSTAHVTGANSLDARFDAIDGGSKAGKTIPQLISSIAEKVAKTDIKKALDYDTDDDTVLQARQGKILKDTIGGTYSTSNTVANAISALDTRLDKVDGGTVLTGSNLVTRVANLESEVDMASADGSRRIDLVEGRTTDVESAISTLNGNANTSGSVLNTVNSRIAEVVNNAPEAFDTLKEIADWIGENSDDALTMQTNISNNASAISGLDTRLTVIDNNTNGRMKTAEDNINTINGKLGSGFNSTTGNTVAEKIAALRTDMETADGLLDGRLDTIEDNLNDQTDGLNARMVAAEDAIDDIEEAATTLEGRVTTLDGENGRVKAAEDDINALETALGDNNSGLTGRVTTLEGTVNHQTTGLAATKVIADRADVAAAAANTKIGTGFDNTTVRQAIDAISTTIVLNKNQVNFNNDNEPTTLVSGTIVDKNDYLIQSPENDKYYYWKHINNKWHLMGGAGSGTSSATILPTLPAVADANENTDYYIGTQETGYLHYRFTTINNVKQAILVGTNPANIKRYNIEKIIKGESTYLRLYEFDYGTGNTVTIETSVDDWAASTAYAIDDKVLYQGYFYNCITPNSDEQWTPSHWELLSDMRAVTTIELPRGGGGSTSGAVTRFIRLAPTSITTIQSDDPIYIHFFYSCVDPSAGSFEGHYSLKDQNGLELDSGDINSGEGTGTITTWPQGKEEGQIYNDGYASINVQPYCVLGKNTFSVTIITTTGETYTRTWTIDIKQLSLTSSSPATDTAAIGETIDLVYTPYGAMQKTLIVKVDNVQVKTETLGAGVTGTEQVCTIPAQNIAGAHTIELKLSAFINGETKYSASIIRDYIWYDATDEDTIIIASPYRNTQIKTSQYSEIIIPYSIYKANTNNFTVEYYLGSAATGTPFDTIVLNNTNNGTIRYIPTEASELDSDNSTASNKVYFPDYITLKVENTTITFAYVATPMEIDIAPVAGAVIDFNPATLNNNSANRLPSYLSVSDNFNWSTNWEGDNQDSGGGYRTDEDGKCFVIKAGTYAEIDYQMFKQHNVTNDGVTTTTSNVFDVGAEMKLIFKVTNVRDASTVWFTNMGNFVNTQDEDAKQVGIQLKAHEGWLKTDKASDLADTDVELPEGYVAWSKTRSYAVDDVVVYKAIIYKCIKAISAPAEGEENSWNKKAWQSLGQLETEISATNSYLYFPYSEEDKIELDININQQGNNQNFIMSYEDGVPSKAYPYNYSSGGDILYHVLNNESIIHIGSPDCDVHIYRLRIYNKSLSTNEILKNFIADGATIDERIARYDRNSIYYSPELNNGEGGYTPYKTGAATLDPYRLAERIPDVKVLMLDTPRFTTGKKDFVKGTTLRCIQASGGKVYPANLEKDNWYFFNGYHAGQGTTSDNYGQSARNVDFLFECDGEHYPTKSGNLSDFTTDYVSAVVVGNDKSVYDEREKTWSVTPGVTPDTCTNWMGDHCKISLTHMRNGEAVAEDTSIPNNYFNLKVNVASSENVNNALFQKRYNDFLPYTSLAKNRDSRIKNDMEFVPAVLFIRERGIDINGNPVTRVEFNDDQWHFYALGNLGDSKKTDYTRAYDPTDINEFTVEISDNNTANSQFQSGVFLSDPTDTTTVTIETQAMADNPNIDQDPMKYIYPITSEQWNAKDGNGQYINYRHKTLVSEEFDGDHSFEFRYACKGDYRDGDLINDTSEYTTVPNTDPETMATKPFLTKDDLQFDINKQVWYAFYEWIVTATKEQFKNEAALWFVPSAVEFFYAFTHYYTMMDNRAKNTFWHFAKTGTWRKIPIGRAVPELYHVYEESDGTENGHKPVEGEFDNTKQYYTQYAFDLWVYDTDTACGIDNNGELSFPYGKEDRDYRVSGQPASGWAFNGSGSIFWRRLSDPSSEGGFADEISTLMRQEDVNCFSTAQHLIDQFDEFQNCFPEEIWRLDIERKYIRTFTGLSQDNSITANKQNIRFLRAMMQGRKKYQRRQWVRNQAVYFGSKYGLSNVRTAEHTIEFNIYTPSSDGVTELAVPVDQSQLVIKPYQDMYIDVAVGNSTTNLSTQDFKRAKAGERIVVDCRSGGSAQETRVYIFGGEHIAALENLAPMYPYSGSFGQGKHLKVLDLGSNNPNYNNPRFTSISINPNMPLLERFSVKNCNRLAQSIDLHLSNNLREFEADGSLITGVSLPNYSNIEVLHLPTTVTSVALNSARALDDFYIKNKATGEIDYSNLITLNVNNSDYSENIDWMDIASQTLNEKINYLYLQNLYTASIGDISDLSEFADKKNELEVNIGDDGQIIKHIVLSGQLNVTGYWSEVEKDTYAGLSTSLWPSLQLNVIDDEMHKQTKWKLTYNYEINGESKSYSTYVNNNATIEDIYDNGTIQLPTRPPTAENNYTFGSYDGGYIELSGWRVSGDSETLADKEARLGYPSRVNSNTILEAVFNTEKRKYPVKWYVDGTLIKTSSLTPYGGGTALEAPTVKDIQDAGQITSSATINRNTNPITVTYKIFNGWDKLPININPSAADVSFNINAVWLSGTISVPDLFADTTNLTPVQLLVFSQLQANERAQYIAPSKRFTIQMGYEGQDDSGELLIGPGATHLWTSSRNTQAYSTARFIGTRTYPIESTLKPLAAGNDEFTLAIDYSFDAESIYDQTANEAVLMACYEKNSTTTAGFRLYYKANEGPKISFGDTTTEGGNTNYSRLVGTTTTAKYRNTIVLRHPANSPLLYIYSGVDGTVGSKNDGGIIPDLYSSSVVQTIEWSNVNTDAPLVFGNLSLNNASTTMVGGRGTIYWAKYWNKDLGAGECRQLASWNHEQMTFAIEEYDGMTNGLQRKVFPPVDGLATPNVVITSLTSTSYGHIAYPNNKNIVSNDIVQWENSVLQNAANKRIFYSLPFAWQSIITKTPVFTRVATRSQSNMSGYYYTIGDSDPQRTNDYIFFPSSVEYGNNNTTYKGHEAGGVMNWATGANLLIKSYSASGWINVDSTNISYMNLRFPYIPISNNSESPNRIFINYTGNDTYYNAINEAQGIDGIQRGDIIIHNDTDAYMYVTNDDIAAGVPVVTAATNALFACVSGSSTRGGWIKAESYWTRSPYDQHDTYASFMYVGTKGTLVTSAATPDNTGYGFNYSFSI